ncbi:unnamed protein product, partial [marine sediment metagenome]
RTVINAKIITAGPRGNACRKCKEKVKEPDVLLKVTSYVRHSPHPKVDKFCPDCGVKQVEKGISTLKEMLDTLTNGASDESKLGTIKVRKV